MIRSRDVIAQVKPASQPDSLPLHGESVLRFADASKSKELLIRRDRFIEGLSPFDRQARLQTDNTVTKEEHLRFLQACAQSWTEEEKMVLTSVVEKVRPRLAPLKDVFPKVVWLVKTTGREEGGAAYCRGPAIVIPQAMLKRGERLLIHELFHILSTHNSKLRPALYAIVGFEPAGGEIELPPTLRERKMTNPDAPVIDYVIALDHQGQKLHATPITFSNEPYVAKKGGSIFRYLQFKLMVVEKHEGKWRAAMKDGRPWLLDPRTTPSYHRRIGRNTKYIIHPDEILADNFVHLLMASKGLPTPRVVEKLKKTLYKP